MTFKTKYPVHPSGRPYLGRYLEGAKGRCWGCGRPEGEHRKEMECPDVRGRREGEEEDEGR